MRNPERGASQVPLVVCIVLFVVAAGWGYSQYSERESTSATLAKITDAAKAGDSTQTASVAEVLDQIAAGKRIPSARTQLQAVAEVVGCPNSAKPELLIDVEAFKTTITALLGGLDGGEFTFEMPEERFVAAPDGAVRSAVTGGKVRVAFVTQKDLRNQTMTAKDVMDTVVVPALRRAVNDVKRYSDLAGQARAKNDADAAQAKKDLDQKNAAIAAAADQLRAVEAAGEQKVSDLRKDVNDATAAKQAAEEAKNRTETELNAKIAELKNHLEQARTEVRVVKERKRAVETDTSPDGTVTAVGDRQESTVLNIGKKDNLIPGTTFEVYGLGKGGQQIRKGLVKAVQVGDATTQAAVLELLDSYNPIVPGDLVRSMTYSPKEQIHFALLGRFQKMGKSDAEARLKALGAAVDSKVSIDTHYLVIGAPDEGQNLEETDSYKAAKLYGITIITEQNLAAFTRY